MPPTSVGLPAFDAGTPTQRGLKHALGAPRTICRLNDEFRADFSRGRVVMTAGIASLPNAAQAELTRLVRTFDDFSPDNDPHGEHDFGAIELGDGRYFWKIDYYDSGLRYDSPDPSDPAVTTRVMTIMRSDEY